MAGIEDCLTDMDEELRPGSNVTQKEYAREEEAIKKKVRGTLLVERYVGLTKGKTSKSEIYIPLIPVDVSCAANKAQPGLATS